MNANEEKTRLLVVEDESHLAAGLKLNLQLEGYEVDVAATARQAREFLVRPQIYSAIVLDVMLPDLNGFDLCEKLRAAGNYTPVIMLTALNSPHDRVRGLEAGADDYLVKPFELSELLARVKSLLRRRDWESDPANKSSGATLLQFGNARVDFDAHEAAVSGEPLHLTQLEFALLRHFADHPDRLLSREELFEKVWQMRNYPNNRTVDNFVLRLRKYFEPTPAQPIYFLSIRGRGYRFCPAPKPS